MHILAWIIFGAIAGWIASILVGENDRIGWLGNIIIGIAGAFVGGWIAGFLGLPQDANQFDLGSLLIAILGACLLLFIARLLTQNRPLNR